MSDLIHEGPKDPNKPPVPGEEKPTTERERMKKVYTYVAILFTVAFLLILWTFLMNQTISPPGVSLICMPASLSLKSSLRPRKRTKRRSTRPSAFSPTSCARSTGCLRSKTPTTPAISTPRKTTSEETGTVEFLPKEPLRTGITGDDAPSPAARYQSIVDKLFPDGVK